MFNHILCRFLSRVYLFMQLYCMHVNTVPICLESFLLHAYSQTHISRMIKIGRNFTGLKDNYSNWRLKGLHKLSWDILDICHQPWAFTTRWHHCFFFYLLFFYIQSDHLFALICSSVVLLFCSWISTCFLYLTLYSRPQWSVGHL